MLQLDNKTPFAASCSIFPDERALDTLFINVKSTFIIGSNWTLAKNQLPPQEADEYWGEPLISSIKYPSDIHTGKQATDIIMNGHACAPEKQPVSSLDVSLSVGQVHKTVRVFGDRNWLAGEISQPQEFVSMPLAYERSFGGRVLEENEVGEVEARNPLGVGFSARKNADDCALPNLEDPAQLIRDPADQPAPAAFGAIAPNWLPRAAYAGTYDDHWASHRCPYLPEDFDRRFLNCAHPDLIYPGFLVGDEEVNISSMHPGGALHFRLPQIRLSCRIGLGDKVVQPIFNLETLILEPNQLRLSMVWKAKQPYGKHVKDIKNIEVNLSR